MRTSRVTLAALAVATIALTTPAEARRHPAPQRTTYAPTFDAAMFPAYPAERQARTRHTRSRVARYRAKPLWAAHHSRENRGTHRRPSLQAHGLAEPGDAGSGIVRSHRTGAIAHVGARFAHLFQAYVDDLEQNYGAIVKFMGGWRQGRCSSSSQHPCNKALDVCQTGRDRVDGRCLLPGRSTLIAVAAKHGLQEGGQWCHGDMGHTQVDPSSGPCGSQMAARSHHRHHNRRYARAY